ncbi:MFS transporter [Nocardia takedensis]
MSTEIPRPAERRRARLIWLLAALMVAYMVNSLNKIVFPLLVDDIRHEFDFSLEQAGLQSTIFALGVGLAGIPGGFLLAQFRRKTIIIIGTVTFSAATVLTAFALGFWSMLVAQTVAGVGEALQVTALLVVASTVLPRTPSAAVGSLNVVYGISAIIGPVVATHLVSAFGTWRAPLITLAAIGLLSAAVVGLLVPSWLTEREENVVLDHDEPPLEQATPPSLWNHNTRVMIGAGILSALVSFAYFGLYPTFLKDHHHFDADTVGVIISIGGTGALLSILGGLLTDRFDPRTVLVTAHLGMALVGAALYAGPGTIAWQLPFAVLAGVISNGILFVNVSAVLLKCVPEHYAPQAAGLFVVTWFTPGAAAGYLFGRLSDVAGWSGAGLIQVTLGSVLAAAVFALLRSGELRASPVRIPAAADASVVAPRGENTGATVG